MAKFDAAYEKGLFDRIFTTNLIYQKPEMLERPYYHTVNMERYIAAIIDTLNNGGKLSGLIKPADRIRQAVEEYKKYYQ